MWTWQFVYSRVKGLWFWHAQHFLLILGYVACTVVPVCNWHTHSEFPRFILIIFTCFQWTVGFYCYPKTEHFLLNCFLLLQIIFQCVLKCVLLNLVKTNLLLYCLQCSWCGLQLFSFLMSAQASSLNGNSVYASLCISILLENKTQTCTSSACQHAYSFWDLELSL